MPERRKIGGVEIERRDGPRCWHSLYLGASWQGLEASIGEALWNAAARLAEVDAVADEMAEAYQGWIAAEVAAHQQTRERAEAGLEECQRQRDALVAEAGAAHAEVERLKRENVALCEDVSVARQSLYEVAEQREHLLRDIKALRARVAELEAALAKMKEKT